MSWEGFLKGYLTCWGGSCWVKNFAYMKGIFDLEDGGAQRLVRGVQVWLSGVG
jgi:hypothetical protein